MVETFRSAFANSERPYISYGIRFEDACQRHIETTFKADRVYIIVSKSLSAQTDALDRLKRTLGQRVVGVRVGMRPHTLWSECLEIAKEVASLKPQVIVTLGAGTLTDGAKIIALAAANNATTFDELDKLHSHGDRDAVRNDITVPDIAIISIPTSLSGGEYANIAGGTNDHTKQKVVFTHPTKGPALIILDPELTVTTPDGVWLSSGIRALDHCVEAMCSMKGTEETDKSAAEGIRAIVPGLLRTCVDREDVDARLKSQLGIVCALVALRSGLRMGASHGIGHQLGPLGVGHGETSCILLPAVCKYNIGVNRERQEAAKKVLLELPEVRAVVEEKGLDVQKVDLGDVLDAIISKLGLPRSLTKMGIGEDQFDLLAVNSLKDPACGTNPVSLKEKAQVLEILHMVK